MRSVVEDLVARLNIGSNKIEARDIVNKSKEYERLLDIKCPQGISTNGQKNSQVNVQMCKSIVCIEMACRALRMGESFPKPQAIKHSHVSEREYKHCFTLIQNVLNVKFPISLSELCIQYGCLSLQTKVEETLDMYEQKLLQSLPKHQNQSGINLRRDNHFILAAFYVTFMKHIDSAVLRRQMDKKKLVQKAPECSLHKFNAVVQNIRITCFPDEPGSEDSSRGNHPKTTKQKSASTKRKRSTQNSNEYQTISGRKDDLNSKDENVGEIKEEEKVGAEDVGAEDDSDECEVIIKVTNVEKSCGSSRDITSAENNSRNGRDDDWQEGDNNNNNSYHSSIESPKRSKKKKK